MSDGNKWPHCSSGILKQVNLVENTDRNHKMFQKAKTTTWKTLRIVSGVWTTHVQNTEVCTLHYLYLSPWLRPPTLNSKNSLKPYPLETDLGLALVSPWSVTLINKFFLIFNLSLLKLVISVTDMLYGRQRGLVLQVLINQLYLDSQQFSFNVFTFSLRIILTLLFYHQWGRVHRGHDFAAGTALQLYLFVLLV